MDTPTHMQPLALPVLMNIANAAEPIFSQDNWFDITIRRDLEGNISFALDHPSYRNTFDPAECEIVATFESSSGEPLHQVKTLLFGHAYTTCMGERDYQKWIERWEG